jgi:hypothetical protein
VPPFGDGDVDGLASAAGLVSRLREPAAKATTATRTIATSATPPMIEIFFQSRP